MTAGFSAVCFVELQKDFRRSGAAPPGDLPSVVGGSDGASPQAAVLMEKQTSTDRHPRAGATDIDHVPLSEQRVYALLVWRVLQHRMRERVARQLQEFFQRPPLWGNLAAAAGINNR